MPHRYQPPGPGAPVGRTVRGTPAEDHDLRTLPMFPLGAVLLPHASLPLHVFEPRYRALVRDVLAADREFGVVLIERGHEVGGGDVRTNVGTVARVIQQQELPDGRVALVAVGTRRLRVERWLEDDPYPRAEVAELAEPPAGAGDPERLARAVRQLRRVLALRAELGEPAPPATVATGDDPVRATFQIATFAALGPLDKQRLLAASDVGERLDVLDETLGALAEVLSFRLVGAPGGPGGPHDP